MRINQNVMANNAYRNLSSTNVSLGKSLEKLSSGFRINRAADDAAGLVISQNLRAQTSGLRQATRNAQDGISVVQTAEGALNEVHTILNRMRDLSVQSANTGANDAAARTAAQSEITALSLEVDRIGASTAFGGTNLLDGSYGESHKVIGGAFDFPQPGITVDGLNDSLNFNVGAAFVGIALDHVNYATPEALAAQINTKLAAATGSADLRVSYTVGPQGTTFTFDSAHAFTVAMGNGVGQLHVAVAHAGFFGSGGQFQIGANSGETLAVRIGEVSTTSLSLTMSVLTESDASTAIARLDGAISRVSTQRGSLGAIQNRFESMINNLQVTTENLVASESRIRDTDMAAEMTNFTKNQILSQAGTAMLAQANQVPQSILSLLR